MESFFKKNDIGVSIEYTIVGYYAEDGTKYVIYTDFLEDKNSPTKIKLYVGYFVNGRIVDASLEKRDEIIKKMFDTLKEKTSL